MKMSLCLGAIVLSASLAACGSSTPTSSSASPAASPTEHSGMKHDMGHDLDLGPADAEYDLRFIDAMIPHHEGAVIMAQDLAQKTQRPELQKLAKAIIVAQDQEIAQMKAWRRTWLRRLNGLNCKS